MTSTDDVRLATDDDGPALARLSSECFGYPMPEPPYRDAQGNGRTTYVGTAAGRVVAATAVRAYESWFWGARIATAGIASVKVAAEHRGNGLLTPLFERSLADAAAQGMALSTLYATAPGIYRKFGYETFANFDEETVVPTAALGQVRTHGGSVHRGGVSDIPTMRQVYERWASAHNGPLAREGASFPASDAALAEAFPGLTIARDEDGAASGYAIWERHGGYAGDGVLQVQELIALTETGIRQLLATLGTYASVAPSTVISTSQPDLAQIVLPGDVWRVRKPCPYGIAVLDVASALTARTYPDWMDLDLTFAVTGLPVAGQDGAYRLRVANGSGEVARATDASTSFSARGFALRYAGTHPCVELRRAGLLAGDTADDSRWDAAFSGRQSHIRNYF